MAPADPEVEDPALVLGEDLELVPEEDPVLGPGEDLVLALEEDPQTLTSVSLLLFLLR